MSDAAQRPLHFDCFSGAAGNMILGALLELGAPRERVVETLHGLGISELCMHVESVQRGAIAATYVSFSGPARDSAERRWSGIRELLQNAKLPPRVRARSLAVFETLAHAEAKVHGIDAERVHFHEVGAVDALGDIVGVCAALEELGVDRISASPVALGHGSVETAHGRLPLPAPATLELLRGMPTYPLDVEWETITPTGAALLAALADEFGPMPALVPEAQGFGAGDDRKGPMPNLVRAVLGAPLQSLERDRVAVLEANIDDMSGEHLAHAIERLIDAGALDASLSPLQMKKGRPAQLLRVISTLADRDRLARLVLLETSTLGVRHHELSRVKLVRENVQVETEFGPIQVKRARDPEGHWQAAPEHDSCARAAVERGVPIARVYKAAQTAAGARRVKVDPGPFRLGPVGGRGPAVLCLHGLTGTPYEVRPPAELLATQGFACLGPLLPGHGTTPHELNETPRADWVRAALAGYDELAQTHERVYVVGLSLGGLLGLVIAARRPIAGAVILAAPLDLGLAVRFCVPWLASLVASIPKTPGIVDDEARARHPGYDRMPLRAVRELLHLQHEVLELLGSIEAPLALIYSRSDNTVRERDGERIAKAVRSPVCDLHYLQESGHVMPVDLEGETVARRISDFFRRLEAETRS